MKKIITIISILGIALSSSATIINIPADYLTIQQGIDASCDGDTVLVQPGMYDQFNIIGKFVTVASLFLTTHNEFYIRNTDIHGPDGSHVIRIAFCFSGNPSVIGFRITNGSIGIDCLDSNPVIAHNLIENIMDFEAFEDAYSAGIKCEYSDAILFSNTIDYVFSSSVGGSAYSYGVHCMSSDMALYNNIITRTDVVSGGSSMGSGFYCENSNPVLSNNTIVGNGCSLGGGILSQNSNPALLNDIVWYNTGRQVWGTVTANYCNTSVGLIGEGNIIAEPRFIDWEHGDFHLMSIACGDTADSPCIDAGDPNILDSLLDCSWGLGGPRSDMGAYGGGDSLITGIFDNIPLIPDRFILLQNYPNPFNAQTTIRFVLPQSQNLQLTVYDLLGRRVETVISEYMQEGIHAVTFDASDYPSGVYFARLENSNSSKSIKMLLLK